MSAETTERVQFWTGYQPGFKFTNAEPGTRRFYEEVTAHRYSLEPHILEVAPFYAWMHDRLLDVGCGVATDGVEFARRGAQYVGFDGSPAAVELARRRFEMYGLEGEFVQGDATALPFDDGSFHGIWSHGVIHHFPDTEQAVREMYRVLAPLGEVCVMLYHRRSFNYYVTIMGLRRLLAALLFLPGADRFIARATGEEIEVLRAHKALLRKHGRRYLTDTALFLSNNTDGPGNPLSKVYTRAEAKAMFEAAGFVDVYTQVRFLNLRTYPGGDRFARRKRVRRLGDVFGWHLYVRGRKPA